MHALTAHQSQALDAYEALMVKHPGLFRDRIIRPIEKDRALLEAYAAEHDVVLGVAADTPSVIFIVDLVISRRADGGVLRHPYLRVVSRAQLAGGFGVVVLATIENPLLGPQGSIVLVEQERHALGARVTELPRGFGEAGISGEANALRELEEETGYIGDHARFLGSTAVDSGLTDSKVSFYHVRVMRSTSRRPEVSEAITGVRLATREELLKHVHSGEISDSFTLQALALYEICSLPASPRPARCRRQHQREHDRGGDQRQQHRKA
jgi:ADP-ribose pyrophosphatase